MRVIRRWLARSQSENCASPTFANVEGAVSDVP
jgi:hypothetical protein